MNRKAIAVFVVFTAMLAIVAGLLVRVRANYVLGEPGVTLADIPLYSHDGELVATTSVALPRDVGEYRGTNLPISTIELAMLPPDTIYGRRLYTAPDRFQAMISVVLMGTDRTSIHKPQYCLSGQGEKIVHSEVVTIPISTPHPYDLKVMKLTTESQVYVGDGKFVTRTGLFLYWFVADGQLTPFHGERMWLMGKDLVANGLLQRWAYVAFYTRCEPGQESQTLERLTGFIAASVPEFQLAAGTENRASVLLDLQMAARQNPPLPGAEN